MYNAFRAAYEPALPALTTAITAEAAHPESYRKLADALCVGDAAEAKKVAHDLLELSNSRLAAALERLGDQQ
jgi:DNA-binding FadR family transcriptional regulator